MTALDLVRKIRANPKGSDFQDVRHVEEYVNQRVKEATKELQRELKELERQLGLDQADES